MCVWESLRYNYLHIVSVFVICWSVLVLWIIDPIIPGWKNMFRIRDEEYLALAAIEFMEKEKSSHDVLMQAEPEIKKFLESVLANKKDFDKLNYHRSLCMLRGETFVSKTELESMVDNLKKRRNIASSTSTRKGDSKLKSGAKSTVDNAGYITMDVTNSGNNEVSDDSHGRVPDVAAATGTRRRAKTKIIGGA